MQGVCTAIYMYHCRYSTVCLIPAADLVLTTISDLGHSPLRLATESGLHPTIDPLSLTWKERSESWDVVTPLCETKNHVVDKKSHTIHMPLGICNHGMHTSGY